MPSLSLLLVGYGFRGRQWAQICAARSDLAVRGIVDPSPAAREAAAAEGLRVWPVLGDALAEMGFDAAIVSTPAGEHRSHGMACLESGAAVLMEKPLAPSLEDARQLQRAAESAGRPLLVGQNYRVRPRELTLRSLMASGALGRVRSTSIRARRPAYRLNYPADVAHPYLWDTAIHFLDLLRTRHEDEPEVVHAELKDAPDRWHASIRLGWHDGARAVFDQTIGVADFHTRELIRGTGGFVYAGTGRAFVAGRRFRHFRWAVDTRAEDRILDDLVGALEGIPTELDAVDNLKTIALAEAALKSSRSGAPIRLSEQVPQPSARSEGDHHG